MTSFVENGLPAQKKKVLFCIWFHVYAFCIRYSSTTNDVLTSVKKMEESLKRLKRGKASQTAGGMSDDDKIRLQLHLDVQEYGKQVGQQTIF